MKFTARNVRLSFPKIWKAEAFANDPTSKPAFSTSFILQADDPQVGELNALIEELAREDWKEKAPAILAQLRAKDDICLHDGNLKSQYEGYAGNWYVTARSAGKPLIIDRDRTELTEQDGRPYGGCYATVSIDVYVQDNKFGKRVNASLRGVQFVQDGDAFSGGPPASPEEFDDLGVSELA